MEISDALPLQWWPTGTESFGQESVGYIDDICWNQVFLCSDLIRDQVNDDAEFQPFTLDVEKEGEVITTLNYINNSQLLVNDDMSDFVGSNWEQAQLGGFFSNNPWTQGSGRIQAAITYHPGDIDNTQIIYRPITILQNKSYLFNIRWALADNGIGGHEYILFVQFIKDGIIVQQEIIATHTGVTSSFVQDVSYTIDSIVDADYFGFYVILDTDVENETTAYVENVVVTRVSNENNISFYADDFGGCSSALVFRVRNKNGDEVRFTDPIKFVPTWENTPYSGSVLIQYNSVQNYSGIYYPITGHFSIRLDGRFAHERIQGTQKSLALSSSSVSTSSTLKKQRLLTLDAMPDYMHRKVQEILAHSISGDVIINGRNWLIDDSYEQKELNEFNPLKTADVYLTDKNYLKRNVI